MYIMKESANLRKIFLPQRKRKHAPPRRASVICRQFVSSWHTFFFILSMCGQMCGHGFLLSLFFNAPTLFCAYVAHDGKGSGTAAGRNLDAGGGGQGAQGPPAHALRGLHILEPPGIVASPDQRFDSPTIRFHLATQIKKVPGGHPLRGSPEAASPHGWQFFV